MNRGVGARAALGSAEQQPAPGYQLDEEQKKELIGAVAAEDLRRLAQLARKDPEEKA